MALRSSFIQLVGVGALGVLSASVSVVSGCEEAPPFTLGTGGDGGGSSNGNGGSGGAFVDNGKELFAALEAELVANCAECHEPSGIADTPFLAGPDRYQSMYTWPDIVVSDPAESILLTYSITGQGHTGTNVDTIEGDFQARLTAWLEAEAAAIAAPVTGGAAIDPITPILGLNVIYLTPLDDSLEGIALTFTAEELTPSSLKLSNMQVFTTAVTGVHLVHPVFAVYPKGEDGSADPVDSFGGLDQRFDENTVGMLGVGTVILTNWEAEAKLGVGFELAEPYVAGQGEGGGGGGAATGGCNAVTEFEDNVVAALQPCLQCHGGNNTGATAAVDMSELGSNPGATCGQVKNRVNLTTPAQSQLFLVTNPDGNASHNFKFNNNVGNWNNFVSDVTVWINAE